MVLSENIGQSIMGYRIAGGAVTQACALTQRRQNIGRTAHGFGPAGQNGGGFSGAYRAECQIDRFQTRTANLVDGVCRRRHRHAAADGDLARRILAETGLQHIADDHFIHACGTQAGTLQSRHGGDAAQFRCRQLRKTAVQRADRSSCGACNQYFFHILSSPLVAAKMEFGISLSWSAISGLKAI
ncbi:hypothetical protein SDC9_117149 [bioreactor metagenome]|uniref:Uncharacterized protein n=1 Tax=bioreactor metagenome TaxID=1076179 RepID=A0A645BXE9_9ZZZZ